MPIRATRVAGDIFISLYPAIGEPASKQTRQGRYSGLVNRLEVGVIAASTCPPRGSTPGHGLTSCFSSHWRNASTVTRRRAPIFRLFRSPQEIA
jgi:hypothetical protein